MLVLEGREKKDLASKIQKNVNPEAVLEIPLCSLFFYKVGAEGSRRKGCSPSSLRSPNSPSGGFPQPPAALGSTNMDEAAVHSSQTSSGAMRQ